MFGSQFWQQKKWFREVREGHGNMNERFNYTPED